MRTRTLFILIFSICSISISGDNDIHTPDVPVDDDEEYYGDINNDGKTDILDMALLIHALNGQADTALAYCYDVNDDGNVDMEDVSKLKELILSKNNAEAKAHNTPILTALSDSTTVESR